MNKSGIKRILAIFLALLMCVTLTFSLVACTDKDGDAASEIKPPEETKLVAKKVGLVQYASNPTLDLVREGIMNRVEEWGFGENEYTLDYRNAEGNDEQATQICEDFVADKVDVIIAIATPAAKIASEVTKETDVDVVFAAVNHPEKDLGIVSLDSPEGNMTGTSDKVDVKQIVDLALQVNPGIKKFGFVFDTTDLSSVSIIDDARAYLEEKEIKPVEEHIDEVENVEEATKSLFVEVEAVFIPTDNTISEHIETIIKVAKETKKPIYTADDMHVQQGALAAIGIDYSELANKTADMAIELLSGKKISELPVLVFTDYNTYVNQDTYELMGVEIPDEIMERAVFY